MRELSIDAYTSVYGGECGATGMCGSDSGGYGDAAAGFNAESCFTTALNWGGLGSTFANMGFPGRAASIIGFAVGANAALSLSAECSNATF
jgi:hypothetical protein